jgi:histidine triad (HIT) family protein
VTSDVVTSDERGTDVPDECWLMAAIACFESLIIVTAGTYSVMNLKFSIARSLGTFFVSALLFVQAAPLGAQQIPADELPPAGTDTGLDGKYDPENGIAQLIRDKTPKAAVGKIFEDEHVLVFMPLPEEEVVAPGHVLVVPKRLGARNLLDLKPDEMRDLLVAVQKAAIAQKNGLGATGFRVQQNNGLSSSQTVYHSHFHVIPSFGGKAPGTPAPRRKLPEAEYKEIAAKLRAAWPK